MAASSKRTLAIGDIDIILEAINQSKDIGHPPEKFIYSMLRDDASFEMAVNGSLGSPVIFEYVAPEPVLMSRINLQINDILPTADKFGGIAALTNGVLIQIRDTDDTTLIDFSDNIGIKANHDFVLLAGIDVDIVSGGGVGLVAVRFTVSKAGNLLRLETGQKFVLVVRDNLTGLDSFEAMVQGVTVAN